MGLVCISTRFTEGADREKQRLRRRSPPFVWVFFFFLGNDTVRVALWLAWPSAPALCSSPFPQLLFRGPGARYWSPAACPRVALRALSKSYACDSSRGPSGRHFLAVCRGGRLALAVAKLRAPISFVYPAGAPSIGSCGIGAASDGTSFLESRRTHAFPLPALVSSRVGGNMSFSTVCFRHVSKPFLHLFAGYFS